MQVDLSRIFNSLNTIHHRWVVRDQETDGTTVGDFLAAKLPHVAPSSWPEREAWGGIFLNGHRTALSTPIPLPCWVEYYEPKNGVAAAREELNPLCINEHLLFEDEFLGVIWKPPRLHSNIPREQDHFSVRKQLDQHYGRPVHLPSRLDFSTCGLLIYSHHSSCHNPLQQLFQQHVIEKWYVAEGRGRAEWDRYSCSGLIGRDNRHPILRTMSCLRGKPSLTDFEVLRRKAHSTVFLAKPLTGRTHQIRLHLATLGHPLHGDNFYDGNHHSLLHLMAYRLRFLHPLTGDLVDLTVPERLLPEWFGSGAPYRSLAATSPGEPKAA